MNENRRQILEMLAQGKVTAEEAERLIAALEGGAGTTSSVVEANRPRTRPKYLRVLVEPTEENKTPTKVNIRVPMQLLRAGVKLASFIPVQARAQVDEALHESGMSVDLSQLKPENLEELIDHLTDLTVDVDEHNNKVRVFCE